jgi:ABC-type nickel/cobalt efflux system permease component RcnA
VLEVVSGLLVVAIGGWLYAQRLRGALGHPDGEHEHRHEDSHSHAHLHDGDDSHAHAVQHSALSPRPHPHSHGGRAHSHLPPAADGRPATWRSLLALGVSGGLLPCPSALVVLLSAIALHRVAFGLLLIVAFSLGLAGVLVGIGLLLVCARRALQRVRFTFSGNLLTRLAPVGSALVILLAGAAITAQALPQVL